MKTIGIVGSGIIGLALAYKLSNKYKVVVFEKEATIGRHQSGNNSGVLHCGLYYKPHSLKAKFAYEGIRQMINFCKQHHIRHEICGKVVVSSNERESSTLEGLANNGKINGLEGLKFLTPEELRKREPNAYAHKALLVPEEGIVDFKEVMQRFYEMIMENNGKFYFNHKVECVIESQDNIILKTGNGKEFPLDMVVNCAGLYTDKIYTAFTGKNCPIKIVPFRGEYMQLKEAYSDIFHHLIYPVPDIQYPFLGVHFTRMVDSTKEIGPNAVFATMREGYNVTDFSLAETMDSLMYKGFLRFVKNNLLFASNEFLSSLSRKSFVAKAKKLIPDVEDYMIEKGNAGVRAQAMSEEGQLLMDFNILREGRQIHVLNAPSPGATSSLSIADYIVERYIE